MQYVAGIFRLRPNSGQNLINLAGVASLQERSQLRADTQPCAATSSRSCDLSMKWITLSLTWNMGDVRAVLTFMVSLLCALGIWVFAYCRWKNRTRQISPTNSVELLSLLSINGFGDAIDALWIVPWSTRFVHHLPLVLHCAVVVVLSCGSVLAGPFARWSTRFGHVLTDTDIGGYMATTNHSGIGSALVLWNETIESLNAAGFPHDQLLDWLPDPSKDWRYEASQWNSTWSIDCSYIPRTSFEAIATGNESGFLIDEIPALLDAFPDDVVDQWASLRRSATWRGYFQDGMNQDLLMFYLVETNPSTNADDTVRVFKNNETLRINLVAYHIHNIPDSAAGSGTDFGVGTAESAAYTAIDCHIKRAREASDFHYAYPWTNDTASFIDAISMFYEAGLAQQSIQRTEVYHPSPEDLVRFYQTYIVSKDTQFRHQATRTIKAMRQSIEIAWPTVVLLGLYILTLTALICWIMLVNVLQFLLKHHAQGEIKAGQQPQPQHGIFPNISNVPRTKLDWLLQGIRESAGRDHDRTFFAKSARAMEDDARAAIFGPTSDLHGNVHVGIGIKSDIPLPTQINVHIDRKDPV